MPVSEKLHALFDSFSMQLLVFNEGPCWIWRTCLVTGCRSLSVVIIVVIFIIALIIIPTIITTIVIISIIISTSTSISIIVIIIAYGSP